MQNDSSSSSSQASTSDLGLSSIDSNSSSSSSKNFSCRPLINHQHTKNNHDSVSHLSTSLPNTDADDHSASLLFIPTSKSQVTTSSSSLSSISSISPSYHVSPQPLPPDHQIPSPPSQNRHYHHHRQMVSNNTPRHHHHHHHRHHHKSSSNDFKCTCEANEPKHNCRVCTFNYPVHVQFRRSDNMPSPVVATSSNAANSNVKPISSTLIALLTLTKPTTNTFIPAPNISLADLQTKTNSSPTNHRLMH